MPPVVPPEPPGAYATNSLDCLNLIALAAVEAGTDDPAAIAEEMIDVSVVGSLCNSFAACRDIAEQDRNFNYQGANSIDFSERGDPARGRIGTFSLRRHGARHCRRPGDDHRDRPSAELQRRGRRR